MACCLFSTNRSYRCSSSCYPCPIFYSNNNCNCQTGAVVNPVVLPSFAFFSLTIPTEVTAGAEVPLALVTNSGTAISSTTAGFATLATGTYEAIYSVTSEIGAGGVNTFGLSLGGTTIPASVSTSTGAAGAQTTVGNSVIFTVGTPTTLALNNLAVDTVTVNNANLTIRKIN